MNKSKIDYCDSTWNPVTGCLHGCKYCYAERIATRFGTLKKYLGINEVKELLKRDHGYEIGRDYWIEGECISLKRPVGCESNKQYPFNFRPTFHRYRLEEPKRKTKPQKIFVCSMADLFGEWVPDEWIIEIFKTVKESPQHTFLFLTKYPNRYVTLYSTYGAMFFPKNAFFGATGDTKNRLYAARDAFYELKSYDESEGFTSIRTFVSIEPLSEDVTTDMRCDCTKGQPFDWCNWVIVGGQTGPGAIAPEKHWVQSIIEECSMVEVPLFLKNNLNWGKMHQEYPW